ncbi:MAG: GyrI-like domain-containing protein [Actinomycetia bacterium]|nr:GyrI-like domain-containing protein [Actinomycetes bacterium]
MAPVDLKKHLDSYAARRGEFRVLKVPVLRYLMIDGSGDPNTAESYADALATLYPVAYALKFASKARGQDYVVPPLEALWWADDMRTFTSARDKSSWQWTAMLLVPEWVTDEAVAETITTVGETKQPPSIELLRLESLTEGLCVQTLHIGPYDDEGPVLAELHDRFLPDEGLELTGRHHEIYLSDPRRAAPEKLRTILRQPVERR